MYMCIFIWGVHRIWYNDTHTHTHTHTHTCRWGPVKLAVTTTVLIYYNFATLLILDFPHTHAGEDLSKWQAMMWHYVWWWCDTMYDDVTPCRRGPVEMAGKTVWDLEDRGHREGDLWRKAQVEWIYVRRRIRARRRIHVRCDTEKEIFGEKLR